MPEPVIGIQSSGWLDDRTPGGRVRVQDMMNGLIPLPIREGTYTTTLSSGASVGYNQSYDNFDGSGRCLVVSLGAVPTITTSSTVTFASVRFKVRGPVVGIRVLLGFGFGGVTASQSFTVMIDGVPYNVNCQSNLIDTQNGWAPSTNGGYHDYTVILANDLPDITHDVELEFQNHDVTALTATPIWTIYGFVVARAAGYVDSPRYGTWYPTTAVPTSIGAIPQSNTAATRFPALRKVHYYNSTALPITVTLSYSNVPFYGFSVPASGSFDYDPGRSCTGWAANLKHVATASGVVATLVGDL